MRFESTELAKGRKRNLDAPSQIFGPFECDDCDSPTRLSRLQYVSGRLTILDVWRVRWEGTVGARLLSSF